MPKRKFKIKHENVQWKPEGLFEFYRALTAQDKPAQQIAVAVNFAEDFFQKLRAKYNGILRYEVTKYYFEGALFVIEIEVETA